MAKKIIPQVRLKLKSIMDERGLTADAVVDLCKEAGTAITRTTVYNLADANAKGLKYKSLTALCNGLKVTPAELFTMEEK